MKRVASRFPVNGGGLYWISGRLAIRLEHVLRVFNRRMLLSSNEYIDLTVRELRTLRLAMAGRDGQTMRGLKGELYTADTKKGVAS